MKYNDRFYSVGELAELIEKQEREAQARAFKAGEKFAKFATRSALACAFVAGVIAGYGWAYYHYVVL